jgi:hypothetical protein
MSFSLYLYTSPKFVANCLTVVISSFFSHFNFPYLQIQNFQQQSWSQEVFKQQVELHQKLYLSLKWKFMLCFVFV